MHLKDRGRGDPIVYSMLDMHDAVYASERIPEELTAYKAAEDFMGFVIKDDDRLSDEFQYGAWYLRSGDKPTR